MKIELAELEVIFQGTRFDHPGRKAMRMEPKNDPGGAEPVTPNPRPKKERVGESMFIKTVKSISDMADRKKFVDAVRLTTEIISDKQEVKEEKQKWEELQRFRNIEKNFDKKLQRKRLKESMARRIQRHSVASQ